MNENQRPIWIIIFAILLASIAIRTKAQGPTVSLVEANAQEVVPDPVFDVDEPPKPSALEAGDADVGELEYDKTRYTTIQLGDQIRVVERASVKKQMDDQQHSVVSDAGARPEYAFLTAELGQFDSDADPDGWVATVMLFDADDRPVIRRATAQFELQPRVPTHDFTGYVNANVKSIKWSKPLEFGADGRATVRLRLQNPITPLVGWPATSHPAVGAAGGFYSSRRGIIRNTTPTYRARTAVTDVQRRRGALGAIGTAAYGQLKLRVSVPTEGVFDAVTPVVIRPSVLVDTRWPYQ